MHQGPDRPGPWWNNLPAGGAPSRPLDPHPAPHPFRSARRKADPTYPAASAIGTLNAP
jgi:hypothetical protein